MSRAGQILQLIGLMTIPLAGCAVPPLSEQEILERMEAEARKNTAQMSTEPTPTLVAPYVEKFVHAGSLTIISDGIESVYPVYEYNPQIPLTEIGTLGVPEEDPLIEETPMGTFLSVHRTPDPNALGGIISRLAYGETFILNGTTYVVTTRVIIPNGIPYGKMVDENWKPLFPETTEGLSDLPVFLNTCTLPSDFPPGEEYKGFGDTRFFIGALTLTDYRKEFNLSDFGK